MSLKLIAIDMDNTLLREDKSYDQERLNYIVDEMKKRQILFCVASGNIYATLNDYLAESDTGGVYFASDNGNYLVKDDEVITETSIPREDFLAFTKKIEERGHYNILVSLGDEVYSKPLDEDKIDFIHHYYRNIQVVDDYTDIPEKPIVKVACLSEYGLEDDKKLASLVKKSFPHLDSVTSGQGWIDIFNKDGGKGTSIAYLQDKYNISAEEIMAFGDSMNDASMMPEVSYSVAVSNADEELKSICKYEIGSNEDQAVFDTLEEFLEQGQLDFMEKYRTNK